MHIQSQDEKKMDQRDVDDLARGSSSGHSGEIVGLIVSKADLKFSEARERLKSSLLVNAATE
jgi:hypothetical protein